MHKQLLSALIEQIELSTEQPFKVEDVKTCSGGCINEAYVLIGSQQSYFVKTNAVGALEMFTTEGLALQEIRSTNTLRAPAPITQGVHRQHAYLILEALQFGSATQKSWAAFGEQLAALHRQTQLTFGWQHDNTIGRTAQVNTRTSHWADFFTQHRIEFQLKLAEQNGMCFERANALARAVHNQLEQHQCEPSLLHGDLWSGNAAVLNDGRPVIFDPASYYGDREADLAFTELFGGFPPQFYRSYENSWPLADDYSERKQIYNLYHVLNHANLFGGTYVPQAQCMIDEITRKAG